MLIENNQVLTTSLKVAENFGKKHKNVIRSIKKLIAEIGELNFEPSSMFIKSCYTNAQNKQQPMYYMNRDGFLLLAMGFTGKKALEFKLAFIGEFNRMETALLRPAVKRT